MSKEKIQQKAFRIYTMQIGRNSFQIKSLMMIQFYCEAWSSKIKNK